jgi:hypothetical protein
MPRGGRDAETLVVKKAGDRNLDAAIMKAMEECYATMRAFSKALTNL